MIYKFKSKAAGDVIMLGPNGDQVLRLLGREPAARGIIEVSDMPAAIATLRAAVAREEEPKDDDDDQPTAEARVSLRQRVWPLVDMLERCQAAGEVIVWGV